MTGVATTPLAVDAMNAVRPVPHVLIRWNDKSQRWWVVCDRCNVSNWHCAYWIDVTEMQQRLLEHSKQHVECRP